MKIAFAYNVKRNKPSLDIAKQDDFDFDSPETIKGIEYTIKSLGHEVVRVEADQNAFLKLKRLKGKIDLVFTIAEGLYGDARESQIPIICEILKIPYTHSNATTHAIKLDKSLCKLAIRGIDVYVPNSFILKKDIIRNGVTNGTAQPLFPGKIKYPLLIKPNKEGSSIGVFDKNVVQNEKQMKIRMRKLYKDGFKGELMAEEYIDGREFTVAVVGNKNLKVLPILEQKFDFLPKGYNKLASFELKWLFEDTLKNLTDAYDCPAKISKKLQKEIEETSLAIYKALNVRDCARIDYRLSAKGELYFIEINTLPGITPDLNVISYLPIIARTAGLSYKDLVGLIIKEARGRYGI